MGRAGGAVLAAVLCAAALVALTWPLFAFPPTGVSPGAPFPDLAPLRLLANAREEPVVGAAPEPTLWGIAACRDTLRGIWTLAWWSHAALHPPAGSWFDANVFHPLPRALT